MPDEHPAERELRQAPSRVAALAVRQGGAVSTAQCYEHGLDAKTLSRLRAKGWLSSQHRGVLRLGTLTPDGLLWAAVLALGGPATICLLSAGHDHGLLRGRPPTQVHVALPTPRRKRRGIAPHEATVHPADVVNRRGLPFTSRARTLLDLAAVLTEPRLGAAVDEARHQRRLHLPTIEATIARSPGHHGIGRLRAAVARHDPSRGIPRRELERMAARFLRDRRFPPHERNAEVRLDGEVYVVDVLFTGRKVVLEFDSRTYHDNDPSFARDRRRIRRFEAHHWRLIPVTAVDLADRPDELDHDIRRILGP